MTDAEKEIQARLSALTPADQERVLEYIREISGEPRELKPGSDLLQFAGIWTEEEADKVSRATGGGCGRVDPGGS